MFRSVTSLRRGIRMLNRQFLNWAEGAPVGERADAARDLGRAFLYADLGAAERAAAERAMTALLDDPSPVVRRTLAEALARAAHAPHHLVSALANDQADIAAVVLGRSPILTDAELIDAAALGEGPAQAAIASRPGLSAAVAGALAEVGGLDALRILCRNGSATLADVSVRRMLERFGADGPLREALGARADLGAALRHDLVCATAEALRAFAVGCGWLSPERARRVANDAGERAAVVLARGEAEGDLSDLAAGLRAAGRLTPALVMRAALGGDAALLGACLAELSGQAAGRVAGLVRRPEGLAFAALVRAAGLPEVLLPALRTALLARKPSAAPALRRDVLAEVLSRCGLDRGSPAAGLTALLRRLEAEAAREESRAAVPPSAPGERRPPARPARIEPRFAAAA